MVELLACGLKDDYAGICPWRPEWNYGHAVDDNSVYILNDIYRTLIRISLKYDPNVHTRA